MEANDKSLRRMQKLVQLRKDKCEQDAARTDRSRRAGSKLRDELINCSTSLEFASLTQRHVNRTVDIIDRGLECLRQQHAAELANINRAEQTHQWLANRRSTLAQLRERKGLEDMCNEQHGRASPRQDGSTTLSRRFKGSEA